MPRQDTGRQNPYKALQASSQSSQLSPHTSRTTTEFLAAPVTAHPRAALQLEFCSVSQTRPCPVPVFSVWHNVIILPLSFMSELIFTHITDPRYLRSNLYMAFWRSAHSKEHRVQEVAFSCLLYNFPLCFMFHLTRCTRLQNHQNKITFRSHETKFRTNYWIFVLIYGHSILAFNPSTKNIAELCVCL